MTEKRFNYIAFDGFEDNGEYITPYEVMKLLNEQHETIGRLKQNINELLSVNVEEELLKENEQLKQALREQLEDNGNTYCIKILDKIFDLKYDEWQRKMNETHTYNYIDWERVLKDKGDDDD